MNLSGADYENLLKFYTYINHDYDRFQDNVLFALEEYFGLKMTVYSIFDENTDGVTFVEDVRSRNIYPAGLRAYQRGVFQTDLFVARGYYSRQGSDQKYAQIIPGISTYEEFYDTDYGRYLQRINTPYQAVLRSVKAHALPVHVLCVFKTQEQGEFNAYELKLLNGIGQIFSESVGHYKHFMAQRRFIGFLDVETRQNSHRLAILDDFGTLIYRSPEFMQAAVECFGTPGEAPCLNTLLALIEQQCGVRLCELTTPALLRRGDYAVDLQIHYLPLRDTLKKSFFCTLQKRKGQEPEAPEEARRRALVEEYNLTAREAEIAGLLATGQNNADIANNLCISVPTVKFQLNSRLDRRLFFCLSKGIGRRQRPSIFLLISMFPARLQGRKLRL